MSYTLATYKTLSAGPIQTISPTPLPGDAADASNTNFRNLADSILTLASTISGLGTAAQHAATDFDAAGAASAVNSMLTASLNLKAPLASPTFTGTVNAGSITSTGTISGAKASIVVNDSYPGQSGTIFTVGSTSFGQVQISAQGTITTGGSITCNNAIFSTRVSATSVPGFAGDGSAVTSLNASAITTGTIAAARLPTLNYLPLSGGTVTGSITATSFSGDGSLLTMPAAPQFIISANTAVFSNVPSGSSLRVYKYTPKKSGSHTSKKGAAHTMSARKGKRYYLLRTMASFAGTWHITDAVSSIPHSSINHGMFRFSYYNPSTGVEGPQSVACKYEHATRSDNSGMSLIL